MRKSNVCWLLLVVFFVVTFCQRLPFLGNCSIYFHPCVCVVSKFKTRIVHEYHMLGCGYIQCQVPHAIISQMKGRIKINWSSKPKRHAHWNLSFIAQWSNVLLLCWSILAQHITRSSRKKDVPCSFKVPLFFVSCLSCHIVQIPVMNFGYRNLPPGEKGLPRNRSDRLTAARKGCCLMMLMLVLVVLVMMMMMMMIFASVVLPWHDDFKHDRAYFMILM